MFGLSHAQLVAGGEQILDASKDVNQVLFQSAAGIASLGKVKEGLLAEAALKSVQGLEKATLALEKAKVELAVALQSGGAANPDEVIKTMLQAESLPSLLFGER